MALYIPRRRRRRTAALIALATLVVGFTVGYLLGRQATPSVASSVRTTLDRADQLATELDRLPIEYEQAVTGAGDSIEAGVLDPLLAAKDRLTGLLNDAPWVGADARERVQDAVASVELVARDAAPATDFAAAVKEASAAVRAVFGLGSP